MKYNSSRKNFFQKIKENDNKIIYFVLTMIMLAAISVIAANVVVVSEDENATPEQSSYIETTYTPSDDTVDENKYVFPDKILCVLKNEGILVTLKHSITDDSSDEETDLFEVIATSLCNMSDSVKSLPDNTVIKAGADAAKSPWATSDITGEYYVQYMTYFSNSFYVHSAFYTENQNKKSIVKETFNNLSDPEYESLSGITTSYISSKWIYENVPLDAEIRIFNDLEAMNSFIDNIISSDKPVLTEDDLYNPDYFIDSELIYENKLIQIPELLSSDPSDKMAEDMWCPYEVGEIKLPTIASFYEFGSLSAQALITNSISILGFFRPVKVYATDGTDISNYMNIFTTYEYTEEEIKSLNIKGYLAPGTYEFTICVYDYNGVETSTNVQIIILDTTPPVISPVPNINELLNGLSVDKLNNSEFVKSLVTINDLCILSTDELVYSYSIDNNNVSIKYGIRDSYGNEGEYTIEAQLN